MAAATKDGDRRLREEKERPVTARSEVVDILATAVFAILLEARAPRPTPECAEQQGECS